MKHTVSLQGGRGIDAADNPVKEEEPAAGRLTFNEAAASMPRITWRLIEAGLAVRVGLQGGRGIDAADNPIGNCTSPSASSHLQGGRGIDAADNAAPPAWRVRAVRRPSMRPRHRCRG